MRLEIPELALVCLMGTSGSGKSTLARRLFLPTQVLSSDFFRGMVSDDENSQEATKPAFEALHMILDKRLQLGRLTVVDATNVQAGARESLLEAASRRHSLKVLIALDVPEHVCQERNSHRPDRQMGPHVIRNQRAEFRRSLSQVRKEGWHKIYILKPEDIEAAEVVLTRIWSRRPEEKGPFDIIGDIHGCLAELEELLEKLGWVKGSGQADEPAWTHPAGRRLIFLGDLTDRGPHPVKVVKLVMNLCSHGQAFCVPGNHDEKLQRALRGRRVAMSHGLQETMDQFDRESEEFRQEAGAFLYDLVSHLVLDEGKLCVAHAGLVEEMQGRGSSSVRSFALYGDVTGEKDGFGLPVRQDWARRYRGRAMVVYGHTPQAKPVWVNSTINIDTGCCFGGSLTALRYPERELVQVAARHVYCVPPRPFQEAAPSKGEDVLDLEDILGRRSIETALAGRVTIREENAAAALEAMSRFAIDPRWLVTLPPTMSPCESSAREGWLERPEEVFSSYREAGVVHAVCQEKHMGSRALAVLCRDEASAVARFGVEPGMGQGAIFTRTGRRFFDSAPLEREILQRMAAASEPLFADLNSDWLVLDMEVMPWSAKAQGLLQSQYSPVGASAEAHSLAWEEAASSLAARGVEGAEDLARTAQARRENALLFREAYRRYCWPTEGIEGLALAPFHLLASEGRVHSDRPHSWHLEAGKRLAAADPQLFRDTRSLAVDLEDEASCLAAIRWWEELVGQGGEGMVVKPATFLPEGRTQPAMKCRGPEYLRIIYGPDYLDPLNLERLKVRSVKAKRSLALREFALGLEALRRFVDREPLSRVHECVFGVLALESEPIDPRL